VNHNNEDVTTNQAISNEITLHPKSNKQSVTLNLHDVIKYCNISEEDLLRDLESMKNQEILNKHPHNIWHASDGRYKTHLPDEKKTDGRRLIARNTLDAIHEAIISDHKERDKRNMNLEKVYNEWLLWRRDNGTQPNTIKRNADDWKSYLQNSDLSKLKMKDITIDDLETFFYGITQNQAVTQKAFTNVKSLLNGVFKFAIRKPLEIIDRNIVMDIDYSQFRTRCKPSGTNGGMYSEANKKAILNALKGDDNIYSLAISFAFRMHMRIGELVAIKKTDVLENSLLVERSRRRKQYLKDDLSFTKPEYEIEDRIKGNKFKSGRKINLPSKAREIAMRVAELYPEGEYLFMKNGEPIKGHAFNRYLKKICDKLNITYLPSHQIRFTNATALAEAGVKINQLSHDLLHSQVSTTYRYIRQREMDDESKALASEVLNV